MEEEEEAAPVAEGEEEAAAADRLLAATVDVDDELMPTPPAGMECRCGVPELPAACRSNAGVTDEQV